MTGGQSRSKKQKAAMSELQVTSGKTLQRSLVSSGGKKGTSRRSSVTTHCPRDVSDLLATFLENIKEVRDAKDKLPDSAAIDEHNARIGDVVKNSLALQKSSAVTYSAAEQKLHESHVSLAVVSDVGRMVFQSKLTTSSEHLSHFIAYSLAKPPPLALARKLKSVYKKMQRVRLSIEQTSILAEDTEKQLLAPPRVDSYTSGDINALLTDIDNQFELVQRMVVYLRGEIEQLEAVRRAEEARGGGAEDAGDELQYALKDMSISRQEDNNEQNFDLYGEDPQCSTPRVNKAPPNFDLVQCTSADIGTAKKGRTVSVEKHKPSAWDHLRASIKQAKRPNYSFELYEQMTDSSPSSHLAAHESPSRRDHSFRQFSSAYRHLRGSHNASATHTNLVEEAAALAVAQYNSPPPKSSSARLETPHTARSERGAVPFVTSPSWRLTANSPGDWRHIRAYTQPEAASDLVAAGRATTAKAPEAPATGFTKDYTSPLVGVLDFVGTYAERQPKLPPPPPPPAAAPATTAAASDIPVAPGANFKAKQTEARLGEGNELGRRERGSNVSDSPSGPKSRSASQDFTKPTFAASSGVFGSTSGAGTAAGVDKLGFGPKSTEKNDREEAASPTTRKKSSGGSFGSSAPPTPGLASSPGAGTSKSSGGVLGSPGGAALPQTVPEISKMLHDIYAKHAPEKLGDVSKLLTKYAGREKELLDKAIKKYGPLVAAPAPAAPAAVVSSPGGAGLGLVKSLFAPGMLGMPGVPPTSPSGVRSRSASVATSGPPGAVAPGPLGVSTSTGTGTGTGLSTSIFGGGKPTSTGFGPATIGTTPAAVSATNTAPGPFGKSTGMSLFTKPAVTGVGGIGAAPGASPFGPSASTGGTGSLFAKPAAAPAAAAVVDPILQRVTAIYTQHNPSKLTEIPQLMEKYRCKELQLIANLEKKYNVPHEPLPLAQAAPAPAASVFGGGAGATSVLGGGGVAQPSTGFGGGTAGMSLFSKPAAAATPSPFGNSAVTATPSPFGNTAAATPSPFGNNTATPAAGAGVSPFGTVAAAAGVPSPFGNTAVSPFANNSNSTAASGVSPFGNASSGGIGGGVSNSLFGPKTTPSTGFGQQSTLGAGGGLFSGSAGVSGTSSPFTSSNAASVNLGGSGSPFGNTNTQASANAASLSPFNSGFNTPLGKVTGSLFHQHQHQALGALGGDAMAIGNNNSNTGSVEMAATLSPEPVQTSGWGGGATSLFSRSNVGGTGIGMGGSGGSGMGMGGGLGSGNTVAPITSLSNVSQILQRIQAIYTQHNPSKLTEIPQLMEKYRGKELQLIANLEKKYHIDSHSHISLTPSAGGGNGSGSSSGGIGMMGGGMGQNSGFGSFGGNNNSGGFAQQSGTGGLFANNGGGGGFGGMGQSNNNNSSSGTSLFPRTAGTPAPGNSLFHNSNSGMGMGMGGGMSGGIASVGLGASSGGIASMGMGMGTTQTGSGGLSSSTGGSTFGRASTLGSGNPGTGFGAGTGGLFGGGSTTGSIWGSR